MPIATRNREDARVKARRLLLAFVRMEVGSGAVLLLSAAAALVWANSRWAPSYEALWNTEVSLRAGRFVLAHSLRDWINDALMVVFFFVVGLEVKREFLRGALSQSQRAALPAVAAAGGMIVPAALYAIFNYGQATARGWGIPMATDIAFALGVLALLGERVPSRLRIFLLALATVDDIGAIVVIALFYSERIAPVALLCAAVLLGAIYLMQRLGVRTLLYYAPLAVTFWFAVLESGVHATIAGVLLGFATPVEPMPGKESFAEPVPALASEVRRSEDLASHSDGPAGATEAPADALIRLIHPWSSCLVLPVFALANAGVAFSGETLRQTLTSAVGIGVLVGLVAGKPAGIVLFAWLAVRSGLARLAPDVNWRQMAGVGLLGGIGFTVSLFVSDLAFRDVATVARAKMGILLASLLAGIAGYLVLRAASARVAPSS